MSAVLRQARGMNLDLFCLADRLYFDDPLRQSPASQLVDYDAGPVPPGWRQIVQREWVHLVPDGWDGPRQGWKIHISSTPGDAERVLAVAARYCLDRDIMFKHLRSESVLLTVSAKYAPRGSSGKFLTLYPRDEEQLFCVLDELDPALAGLGGPYVLSDLRWKNGPLYVRYGGFAARHCISSEGAEVLAVETPDGVLVPDERLPYFSVPDWVVVPERLASSGDPSSTDTVASSGYRFDSAVHFSNGGGVYVGTRVRDGLSVVLKEARPHAGLDGARVDAVTRLEHEHAAYQALGALDGVPSLVDYFSLWEHQFLVTSFVEGLPLHRWQAAHHPAVRARSTPADRQEYADAVLVVLDHVASLMDRIHEAGWVHGDLHPGNILVADDLSVSLVDFEQAQPLDAPRAGGLGCRGFMRPGRGAAPLGTRDDEYGLGALALWLLLPLTPVVEFDPAKSSDYIAWAEQSFRLPPRWHELTRLAYADDHPGAGPAVGLSVGDLVRAVTSTASPERDDRLFPGDVLQVLDNGIQLASGAAGVLWALAEVGAQVPLRWTDWLTAHAGSVSRPGLFDGAAGVATTLLRLGREDLGAATLRRAAEAAQHATDASLYGGRAGVGLAVLGHPSVLPDALAEACRIADGIMSLEVPTAPTASKRAAGLVDGWSGVAVFLTRLGVATGDTRFLEQAGECVRRDLANCVVGPDGSLLVDEKGRLLPYLAHGSAGIAIASAELARAGRQCVEPSEVDALVAAMSSELVVEPGVFEGRAGLILALDYVQAAGLAPTQDLLDRHLRALEWHAVSLNGGRAFLGRGLQRLSMDLGTGTAGVAAVLSAVTAGTAPLPFLDARQL